MNIGPAKEFYIETRGGRHLVMETRQTKLI